MTVRHFFGSYPLGRGPRVAFFWQWSSGVRNEVMQLCCPPLLRRWENQCMLSSCIVRPHRSTTYVDAAYSYRPSSVVCRSVCHTSEPCRNGCTDRAAVWVEDLGGSGEPCIRWESRSPMGRGKFWGKNGRPIVKYRDTLWSSVQRRLNR